MIAAIYGRKSTEQNGVSDDATTGEELRLDTPEATLMASARNFGHEFYRHQVRAKTREAMRAKAACGDVAGGRV